MPCYQIYGYHIECSLTLPVLPPTKEVRQPDIRITQDSIAEWPASTPAPAICFRCQGEQVHVKLPGIARMLIRNGNEIIYDPINVEHLDAITLYLLNHALAILMIQRGMLVLHAGAFMQNTKAVAVAGPTGQGKSTLLAHRWQKGHSILGDEHIVIQLEQNRATLLPGLTALQLWEPVLHALGIAHLHTGPVRKGLHKYWVPTADTTAAGPTPLTQLQVLEWSNDCSRQQQPITGADKLPLLIEQVYQWPYINGMAMQRRVAAQCLQLASLIEVQRLRQPRSLAQVSEQACTP